jgi:hypothetical protein
MGAAVPRCAGRAEAFGVAGAIGSVCSVQIFPVEGRRGVQAALETATAVEAGATNERPSARASTRAPRLAKTRAVASNGEAARE